MVVGVLGARLRSTARVAEVEYILAVGQERVRDVQVHVAKAGAFEEVFASEVSMRLGPEDEPGDGKGPVLERLVEVAVLGVRIEHPAHERARELGPLGGLGNLTVQRVSRDAKSGDGNE